MTNRKLFHGLTPAVALTALAIAGCGGGGGNSDASFISKVNDLCKSSQAQANATTQPTGTGIPELLPYLKATLPIGQSLLSSLKAISPPSDKKADYQAAIDNQTQQIDAVQAAITAGDAGNKADFDAAIGKVQTLNSDADALATKIGVSDCVSKNASSSSTTNTTTT